MGRKVQGISQSMGMRIEEGEDSDSGGSNVEEEHVRPYEHDPSFKSKEELEHFLKGCDNRIESESDSVGGTFIVAENGELELYTERPESPTNMSEELF